MQSGWMGERVVGESRNLAPVFSRNSVQLHCTGKRHHCSAPARGGRLCSGGDGDQNWLGSVCRTARNGTASPLQ